MTNMNDEHATPQDEDVVPSLDEDRLPDAAIDYMRASYRADLLETIAQHERADNARLATELTQARRDVLVAQAALQLGVSLDLAGRLHGDTVADMAADLQDIAAYVNTTPSRPAPNIDAGAGGYERPVPPNFLSMTPDQQRKAMAEMRARGGYDADRLKER